MNRWSPRVIITGAVAALVVVWLLSGFYFVRADERAVVRWFGAVPVGARSIGPGLHYALPGPICQVDRPRTTEVRRVYVGLLPEDREAIARGNLRALTNSPRSDMLTGDVNILKTTMVVQYQVSDPAAFLFEVEDPDEMVRTVVQSVLLDELASRPVDQALTASKSAIQLQTQLRSQSMLDAYGSGVHIVSTDLEAIEPPRAIVAAFQEVVSAQKDGERAMDEAVTERNRMLPRARGEAETMRQAAEAYRLTRLSTARGESARFLALLAEYRLAPGVLRDRLLIERMEVVLPRLRTVIVDRRAGDPATDLRIVDPRP